MRDTLNNLLFPKLLRPFRAETTIEDSYDMNHHQEKLDYKSGGLQIVNKQREYSQWSQIPH